jgi:FMN reductase
MTAPTITGIIGNPRPQSRTHSLCRALVAELAATGGMATEEVDLAELGPRALDRVHPDTAAALERVCAANLLVLASPTYKATYSGLLKVFLDHLATGALAGTPALPIMLGGAPDHRLAVDVHFVPLLLELGASTPVRGLFVLESEVDAFATTARDWARANWPVLNFTRKSQLAELTDSNDRARKNSHIGQHTTA